MSALVERLTGALAEDLKHKRGVALNWFNELHAKVKP
jgi:hypothetical protein